MKSLKQMEDEVIEFEIEKGWKPNDNRFGESIALIHSELSEALEAYREIGLAERNTLDKDGNLKPDDAASELVDVLVRLLSAWGQYFRTIGLDLEAEFEKKMHYNRTRSYRHGNKIL